MKINMIFARSMNGVIGQANTLPWRLAADMARFKALTSGGAVVMGSATWASLPEKFRPLPGRFNVILTHRPELYADSGADFVATNMVQALNKATDMSNSVWVIGGGIVYAEAMQYTDHIYVTDVKLNVKGDAYAPDIPGDQFTRHDVEKHVEDGIYFETSRYDRITQ